MKRLIIINILLLIALNILPKEIKVEATEENLQFDTVVYGAEITSRSLEEPRIKIKEPVPTEISQRGIDFIKSFERMFNNCKET